MGEEEPKNRTKIVTADIGRLPPERVQSEIITPVASQLASQRSRNLLIMYYPSRQMMLPRDVSTTYVMLKRTDKSQPLDLFIHSGGGDIHTAYKLAILCRRCCTSFNSLIPEYAKSAATLLAIGCHNVEMSLIAELGPLDPMIEFDNDTLIPAFAIRESVSVLQREIEESKNEEVRALTAEHILGPIAAKIDPYLLSETSDMPNLAITYGKRLLNDVGYAADTSERILRRLTYERGHPSHGYVIDVGEAKDLGLNVTEMDEETEDACLTLLMALRAYEQGLGRNAHPMTTPFIQLIRPDMAQKKSEKQSTKE